MAQVHFMSIAADKGYLFGVDSYGRLWVHEPDDEPGVWPQANLPEDPSVE